jgi:membrane protein
LVAVGAFATIWAASSGTQSIRTALNCAYGVQQGLPFWRARIKVTIFTIIGALGAIVLFSSVLILPHAWTLLHRTVDSEVEMLWLRAAVRYSLAFVALVLLYSLFYGWLPDVRQRLRTVLPGAVVGALFWLGLAATLQRVLGSLGELALVYGSLAGVVATLVFLYLTAVTLIFGAEINGVLMHESRQRRAGRTPGPPKGVMGDHRPRFPGPRHVASQRQRPSRHHTRRRLQAWVREKSDAKPS